MDDLISRQDAIDALMEILDRPKHAEFLYTDEICKTLNELPSAQPEIIRCKDCKWSDWYTACDGNRYCYCMETGNGGRTENDYCSYAERRTDG